MRILYLHQYFNTPDSGGPLRSYFIAKAMVKAGFSVTVLTTTNEKKGHQSNIEGIEVKYLPIEYSNQMNILKRLNSFLKYILSVRKQIPLLGEFNKCYATSTPLTVGILAIYIKRKLNIPYIFEVRDLWPKVPIELGLINNLWPKKALYKLEKEIYKQAESIVVLSPNMLDYVKKIEPTKTVKLVPNMADCDFFKSIKKSTQENFTIGYIGSLGYANGIDSILELVKSLSSEEHIKFIIAGEGKYKSDVIKSSKQLNNLSYVGTVNREEIKAFYTEIDASLISFRNHPTLEQNSPNKFFEGLAAGRICLTNTKGWVKNLIEENNCGFYIDPKNITEARKTIIKLSKNIKLIQQQQNNSKALSKQFSKDKLTKEIIDLIN